MNRWKLAAVLLLVCLKVDARIDGVFVCGAVSSFDKSKGIAVINGQEIRLTAKEGRKQNISTGPACVQGFPVVMQQEHQIPLLASEIQFRNSVSPKYLKKRFAQFRAMLRAH